VRRQRGREIVREKIKLRIMHPHAVKSLEEYACRTFGKAMFDELTAAELLELWHAIDNSRVWLARSSPWLMGNACMKRTLIKNRS